jgi:hypothetical protein
MDYREYRSRREGAGSRRFILVKYWEPNRMKVRELTKGPSSEKKIEESHYPVWDVDPAKHSRTEDAEANETDWERDGQMSRTPISRSRARPQNREEMIRANDFHDRRQQELRKIPDDTSAGVRVRSDIHFLKAVKAEFRLWFTRFGFELPDEITADQSEPTGCHYGRELYDYLDLRNTSPRQISYDNLKEIWKDINRDRPRGVNIGYNGFHKALKNADLYPSDPDSGTNYGKLIELLKRIVDFVEDEERPV